MPGEREGNIIRGQSGGTGLPGKRRDETMERPKKLGWTEKGIVGMIFTPIGLLFLVLGVVLYAVKAGHRTGDPLIFLLVFGGMGFLFFLLGLIFLFLDVRRRNNMRRALNQGEYIMAKITGVEQHTNISYNGQHPYVVACRYQDPDTRTIHVWYSRYLRFNPEGIMTSDEVPVYMDRYNPEAAYVDIDAVLPEVSVHR